MPEAQKSLIYETSVGKSIAFSGYETHDFILNDDNSLQALPNENQASPCGGSIATSDLTLSVSGVVVKDYTVVGNTVQEIIDYYIVYPSFVWHTPVKVKNDSFSMTMYSGWEARPQERNLRLHLMNSSGVSAQYVDLSPTQSFEQGYTYKVPSTTGSLQGMYEGHAYYNINKKNDNASNAISLHYVHDATTLMNLSYSIQLSEVFGFSISIESNDIYEMSDNLSISGFEN